MVQAVHSQAHAHTARQSVRMLKRCVAVGTRSGATIEDSQRACEAALQLLARSIQNSHRRLALIRLCEAVRVGARVKPEHWQYCKAVAEDGTDPDLRALFLTAKRRHAMHLRALQAAFTPIPGIHSQTKGV